MLSKPESGWVNFRLAGRKVYSLNYLDDIAFEWIDQAIYGLEAIKPFCVKGFCEQGIFLCTVSYKNCHVIIESDEYCPIDKVDVVNEVYHISMIEFCKYLHKDVGKYIDEWADFVNYKEYDIKERKDTLKKMNEKLMILINEKEKFFDENYSLL